MKITLDPDSLKKLEELVLTWLIYDAIHVTTGSSSHDHAGFIQSVFEDWETAKSRAQAHLAVVK